MNMLLKNIFTAAPIHNSNKDIIRWWERRRIFYNGVMLVAGVVTIMLAILLHEISFADTINTLPPILIFAFSANLFFTLGWIMEIVCSRFISEKELLQKTGPILLIAGTSLSVLFTIAIDIALLIAFFFQH
jgi:hypothetical protein